MKKKEASCKINVMFGSTLLLLTLVFLLQVCSKPCDMFKSLLSSMTEAKVETWTAQTWRDKWFGDGYWQTRTLYKINPQSANKSTVYENRKLLLSTKNNSTVAQSASYSYTETIGHTVSAEISAKRKHFEAAFGYSFNYAKSKTYTANVNVPAKKSVKAYGSNVRIKQQYSTYKKQPQRANNLTATSWVNNGSATVSSPLAKQYRGYHIEWS